MPQRAAMTAFRLNTQRVFLTYAQADFEKQALFDFLVALRTSDDHNGIATAKVLVAKEFHQDQGTHYHCYVEFDRKINVRNERLFDFSGKHPNIQTVRSVKNVIKYCTKEDQEPLCNFEYDVQERTVLDILRTAIAEGKSINDAVDEALTEDPTALRYYSNLHSYVAARAVQDKTKEPLYALDGFKISVADRLRLNRFKSDVETMERGDRMGVKSLWLIGPSRFGKTALARSIGKHWYMQGVWCVDNLSDSEHVYGVLDDIPWDSLKFQYRSLLGCQRDVTYTDKYRAKKTFKMGYPVIVCSNELPVFTEEERNWLRVNVEFYEMQGKMYGDVEAMMWYMINP